MSGVASAGVYCEHFSHYLSLGTAKSTFDGEVKAIKVALIIINQSSLIIYRRGPHLNACPLQAVILDSQAAILAITNCSQAPSSMSLIAM
ncbi:hypothetical protein NPIL_686011 [Nephila pilipes]|uniref:Uncharacterized protein n=1 Tax=Nephila pilipes TaxID=299642 RepID=A0A8X6QR59_NEPPI|nr:hypothetical protein NPIL_686011 [Nephila pilipes]